MLALDQTEDSRRLSPINIFIIRLYGSVSRQAIAFLVSRFEMQKKDVPNSIFEMLGVSKKAVQ